MADTKISALSAATTPLDVADVLPVVQGSVSKKATVLDIARVLRPVKTVGSDQTNSTTTPASVTDLEQSLVAGTYYVSGIIVIQTAATGTGIEIYPNCDGGTVTKVVHTISFLGNSTTTAGGIVTGASTTNRLMEARTHRANNVTGGALAGVDAANSDCMLMFDGIVIVTATTTFKLMMASEVAASNAKVMAGSSLSFEKVA